MRVSNNTRNSDEVGPLDRRTMISCFVIIALGLAAAGWLYQSIGERLVRNIYNGQIPWLVHLIKRQNEHPVDYYIGIADHTAFGLLVWAALMLLLYGVLQEMWRRTSQSFFAERTYRWMTTITAAVWLFYLLQIPLLQMLPYWFWSLNDKSLPYAWLLPFLLLGAVAVARTIEHHPQRHGVNLLLLLLLCYALQLGFGFMEGRGIHSLSSRLVGTGGHAELARSGTEWSVSRLLTSYSTMVISGELAAFPHATRPPGPIVTFALLDKVAECLSVRGDSRLQNVARLASWMLPLCAAIALLPLWGLSRQLNGCGHISWVPLVLFATTPSITLMPLHLDQSIFPTLSTACLFLITVALKNGRIFLAVVSGAALYVCLFFSLGLITVVAAMITLGLASRIEESSWHRPLTTLAASLVGFLAIYGLVLVVIDYDALSQFAYGMAAHQAFKFPDWGILHTVYFGALNIVEFGLWCGPPLAILCATQLANSFKRISAITPKDAPLVALVVVLVGLILFGRTAAETARLWIFLIPLVTIAAGRRLSTTTENDSRAITAIITLQLGTTFILKGYQDSF